MILTPVRPERAAPLVAALERQLGPSMRPILTRLVRRPEAAVDLARDHAAAVTLAAFFGMAPVMRDPALSYSWDGRQVSAQTEPSVLLHEVAHFQLASPRRRALPDFGLGAGPETGERERADAALCVTPLEREREEAMASLLGMLWEAALGQWALPAFLEQNWLEGADRPGTAAFFTAIAGALVADGLIDPEGRPNCILRIDRVPELAAASMVPS